MSPDQFSQVIHKVKNYAEEFCLHVMGEPLAHPEFAKILSLSAQAGIKINLTTNGILLNRYKELLLKNTALRQINFSLQAHMDNFPDKPIEPFLTELMFFTQELSINRPEVYVNFRLWNLNSNELLNVLNEKVFRLMESFYQTQINRNVDPSFRKSKKIKDRIYLHFDSRFEWPSLLQPLQGEQGTCQALNTHLAIMADGNVVPCCLDKESVIVLGNVYEENFVTIIESERFQTMLKGFKNGKLEEKLCQHCSYIKRFDKKLPSLLKKNQKTAPALPHKV